MNTLIKTFFFEKNLVYVYGNNLIGKDSDDKFLMGQV